MAGNPIERLNPVVFTPLDYLTDLDVSDCELAAFWPDPTSKTQAAKIFRKLRYFNASNNNIRTIHVSELMVSNSKIQFLEAMYLRKNT